MRTTIDLPDELARAAKIRAAERGETLKQMLSRAIARELADAPQVSRARVRLPLVAANAEPSVDVSSEDIARELAEDDDRHAA